MIKIKNNILRILVLLFVSGIGFAQKKNLEPNYYRDQEKKVHDKVSFEKLKKDIYAEFKKINQLVKVKEIFGPLEKKGDSIIQNFEFKIIPLTLNSKIKKTKAPIFATHLKDRKFSIENLIDNKGIRLKDDYILGKPTLINFWFTACIPCIEELPVLNNLKEKYKGKVNFISVTFDSNEEVLQFLKKHPFNFRHFVGAKKYISDSKIKIYPTTLFLDKNGIIRHIEGSVPPKYVEGVKFLGNGKEFEEVINKLLNK